MNLSHLYHVALFLVFLLIGLPNLGRSSHDYQDALSKAILFFEGQRSGFLPQDQRMSWRANSGLSDGWTYNTDLTGGYYDAGDNIKFGFPMAFTTTMLAWSVLEFGGMMPANEYKNALVAIRWATDYLLKTVSQPNRLFVQVGDPSSDHDCWERPEDMDTARTVYAVDAPNAASDVAGETAAALAASSLAFWSSDPGYAETLLRNAISAFQFADNYRGAYSDNANVKYGACPYYCDFDGFQDELLWGAAWLRRATKDDNFLNYLQSNGKTLGADDNINEFGWDNKHAGLNVLVSKDVMFGGTETVASVIEWTMAEVMKSPMDLHKVQQELVDVVGLGRRFNESDLEKLTFLKFVVKETLRLHPPIPLLLHETAEDSVVAGYSIQTGTRVWINAWAIGRDKNAWDEPEKFNPSRFSREGMPDFKGSNFEFLPFGSGRRSCPGMQLGLYAVEMTVAHLLHCFDWELPDGMKPNELDMSDVFGLTAPRAIRLVAVPTYRLKCPLY